MKRKGILKQVLTVVLTMATLVTGQTAKAIDLTADGSSVTTSETWTDCTVNVTGNGTMWNWGLSPFPLRLARIGTTGTVQPVRRTQTLRH